jgi:hypothetical protein
VIFKSLKAIGSPGGWTGRARAKTADEALRVPAKQAYGDKLGGTETGSTRQDMAITSLLWPSSPTVVFRNGDSADLGLPTFAILMHCSVMIVRTAVEHDIDALAAMRAELWPDLDLSTGYDIGVP